MFLLKVAVSHAHTTRGFRGPGGRLHLGVVPGPVPPVPGGRAVLAPPLEDKRPLTPSVLYSLVRGSPLDPKARRVAALEGPGGGRAISPHSW